MSKDSSIRSAADNPNFIMPVNMPNYTIDDGRTPSYCTGCLNVALVASFPRADAKPWDAPLLDSLTMAYKGV
jgi:hypothetical protein